MAQLAWKKGKETEEGNKGEDRMKRKRDGEVKGMGREKGGTEEAKYPGSL